MMTSSVRASQPAAPRASASSRAAVVATAAPAATTWRREEDDWEVSFRNRKVSFVYIGE